MQEMSKRPSAFPRTNGSAAVRDPWALDQSTGMGRFLMRLAAQDFLLFTYFTALALLTITRAPAQPGPYSWWIAGDAALLGAGIVLHRGQLLPNKRIGEVIYRFTVLASVLSSFFQLTGLLAAFAPRTVDAELLAFDMRVFGYEPALAWDAFVTPRTTEWFSFFYWGYFTLLALHVFPMMLVAKDKTRTADFIRGICIVICTAQLLYFIVPAFGPFYAYKASFTHPLEGPVFWRLVHDTVASVGPRKDVFPSVHTAAPMFLAIFSWRHRKVAPFKYTWIPVACFASQTMLATMFLRWHYMIDVVCGLALAILANFLTAKIGRWENPRRERLGVSPA
jgi:hypothetical protein